MPRSKAVIDDGFNSEFVEDAFFEGALEIPLMLKQEYPQIPGSMIPFSSMGRSKDFSEAVCFYEHDVKFADILREPDKYVTQLSRFPLTIAPDCSLNRDMPLAAQIMSVYRSRAIGYRWQKKGLLVVPNVRWGNEESYTTKMLPEKLAFLGVPKDSTVAVGTYGCIRGRRNERFFIEGLEQMLETLRPRRVLIYGAMPERIFGRFTGRTEFICFPDFISARRGGGE